MLDVALVAARAAIVLTLALVAVRMLRSASAATRRSVLVFAFAAVILLPIASAVLPALHLGGTASPIENRVALSTASAPDSIVYATTHAPSPMIALPTAAPSSASAWRPSPLVIGLSIWALGVIAVLARLSVGLVRARHMARSGTLIATHRVGSRVVQIRTSAAVDTPAVTGVLSSTVLLPRDSSEWSDERRALVLAHELAHVARHDCFANVLAQLACALHWFNPLVWIAARRLRFESELAADDRVLDTGTHASSYAEHLLALATLHTDQPSGVLAMADPSQLEQRIRALLSSDRSRASLMRTRRVALFGTGLAIASVVACASPEPAPPPVTPPDATIHPVLRTIPTTPASTIDPDIQAIIDEEHDKLVTEWLPCASIVIVLDPQTGAVVGVSARGGTEADAQIAARRPMTPGSTIKPLVIAAALEEGVLSPTEKLDASPQNSRGIEDVSPNGWLTPEEILTVSSNVGLVRVFEKLGGAGLATWTKRFHFASAPQAITDDVRSGVAIAIGAGLTSNPLEIAAAFATLANGGVYYAPSFSGTLAPAERVFRPQTAATVLGMLESVTGDRGTGKAARVAGVRVAGKTGTAHIGLDKSNADYYSSFVGTAPLEHPRYVVFVGAETPRDGGSGGQVAAPAFGRIMTRLLARP